MPRVWFEKRRELVFNPSTFAGYLAELGFYVIGCPKSSSTSTSLVIRSHRGHHALGTTDDVKAQLGEIARVHDVRDVRVTTELTKDKSRRGS